MLPVRALLYIELEETVDIRASKVQTDSSYAATIHNNLAHHIIDRSSRLGWSVS